MLQHHKTEDKRTNACSEQDYRSPPETAQRAGMNALGLWTCSPVSASTLPPLVRLGRRGGQHCVNS